MLQIKLEFQNFADLDDLVQSEQWSELAELIHKDNPQWQISQQDLQQILLLAEKRYKKSNLSVPRIDFYSDFIQEIEKQRQRISEVLAMYQKNSTFSVGIPAEPSLKIVKQCSAIVDSAGGFVSGENLDQPIFMASAIKPFFAVLLAQQAALHNRELKFVLNPSIAWEIVWRGHFDRLLGKPEIYSPLVEWIGLNQQEQQLLAYKTPAADYQSLIKSLKDGVRFNWWATPIPRIEIDFAELCFYLLTVSMDSPLILIKNQLLELMGDNQILQKEISNFIPSVELTESTQDLRHWFQYGPNTCIFADYVKGFYKLVDLLTSKEDEPNFAAIRKSMTNNPLNFEFNALGNSELVTEIHQSEVAVIGKTGSYPDIMWPERLAKAGYPVHGSLLEVGILLNDDKVISGFAGFSACEVPVSDQKDYLGLPDTASPEYFEMLVKLKALHASHFRGFVSDLARRALSGSLSSL